MYAVLETLKGTWPHADGEQVFQHHDQYISLRWRRDNDIYTFYLLPAPYENSLLVAARLADSYESLTFQNDDDIEAIEDLYPTVFKLIENSGKDKLGAECAMIRMPDLDIGAKRWFVIAAADDVEADLGNVETQARLGDAIRRVSSSCATVMHALANPPGTGAAMLKGLLRGFRTGFEQTPRIVVEKTISALLNVALQSHHDPKNPRDTGS